MALQDGETRFMNVEIERDMLETGAGHAKGCQRFDCDTNRDPRRLSSARTVTRRLTRLAVLGAAGQCAAPGHDASPTSKTTSPELPLLDLHGPPDMPPKEGRKYNFGAQRQQLQEDEENSEETPQTRLSSGGASPTSPWDQDFPPLPAADTFCEVQLRVNFRAVKEADKYVILADVPGLFIEDASITLNAEGSELRVAGCRHPAPNRAEQLRDRLDARLRQLARCSPEIHQRLLTDMERPEAVAGLYAQLGRGEFGCFAQAFRLPPDADVRKVRATYDGCTMRIVLARVV